MEENRMRIREARARMEFQLALIARYGRQSKAARTLDIPNPQLIVGRNQFL
jgi:hypothetical protein